MKKSLLGLAVGALLLFALAGAIGIGTTEIQAHGQGCGSGHGNGEHGIGSNTTALIHSSGACNGTKS